MFLREPGIELSRQSIPLSPDPQIPERGGVLAGSVPLHGLSEQAPVLPSDYDPAEVKFSFSNDESATYFDQVRSRTALPEYQEATNRVAVVVGESSLAAALPYIPEETIIMVDQSPAMGAFMNRYIEGLRSARTPDDWAEFMGFRHPDTNNDAELKMVSRILFQVEEWRSLGYQHPLADNDAFAEVSELARQKAIIPWRADINSRRDMKRLGKALKAHDAHVTMMNLTNVMACPGALDEASDYAARLRHLPLTPNAPILATTTRPKLTGSFLGLGPIVEATGPFFGLDNLARHGGSTSPYRGGSAVERQYAPAAGRDFEEIFDHNSVIKALLGALGPDLAGVLGPDSDVGARGLNLDLDVVILPGGDQIIMGTAFIDPADKTDPDRKKHGAE